MVDLGGTQEVESETQKIVELGASVLVQVGGEVGA